MLAERDRAYVLELHVIENGSHDVTPVAQCSRIAGGNALGGGTKRELEVALCEGGQANRGEYWLISEPGVVSVQRGPIGSAQQIVHKHQLLDSTARAVSQN